MEEEVDGVVTGDFVVQCVSPLSGLPALGHNPHDEPVSIDDEDRADRISTILSTDKPYRNGSIEWSIPTSFTQYANEIARIIVVQKYILQDGILTIYKGGKELMKEDLNGY